MIPFGDLSREYPVFSAEIRQRLDLIMKHGIFLMGKELEEFENRFAAHLGVSHAIGVSSGTDALIICLRALMIEPGSEVLVPVNTALPTAMAVILAGYQPIFVDIDPHDHLIAIEDARTRLSPTTKAIIPVHLYGNICRMDAIIEFARQNHLYVIEDCAQAHGGTFSGRSVGSWGNCSAFSFYPSKNLGAYGDAGVVTTNDDQIYRACLQTRSYGEYERYRTDRWGGNFRMDEFQAAVLNTKLSSLDNLLTCRIQAAQLYQKKLNRNPNLTLINTPDSVHHLMVIRTPRRDSLQTYLSQHGIQTMIHYPILLPDQPYFKNLQILPHPFPVAESFNPQILSLPLFNFIRDQEIEQVCQTIDHFFQTGD